MFSGKYLNVRFECLAQCIKLAYGRWVNYRPYNEHSRYISLQYRAQHKFGPGLFFSTQALLKNKGVCVDDQI